MVAVLTELETGEVADLLAHLFVCRAGDDHDRPSAFLKPLGHMRLYRSAARCYRAVEVEEQMLFKSFCHVQVKYNQTVICLVIYRHYSKTRRFYADWIYRTGVGGATLCR